MTEISAAMVKELRDATSAGMMDCKRALQETDGDFDAAVKLLREKGHGVRREARRPRDDRGQVGVIVQARHRRDRRGRLRDRAGLEERRLPRVRREGAEAGSRARRGRGRGPRGRACRAGREARREHPGRRREAARGARRRARSRYYVHPPANKVGRSCRRAGRRPAGRPQLAHAPHLRAADVRDRATRCRPSSSTPSARSCSSSDEVQIEAGERPREDRRGDAEQALLRRVGAQRADVVPRDESTATVAKVLEERGIELVDYAWYSVALTWLRRCHNRSGRRSSGASCSSSPARR